MTWTLEVASNAAASSWTDVTALVDRKTWRIGGECPGGGQAGTGFGFDFADDAAAYEFPARRVVRFTIGSTVCGRGRVAVKDLGRGTAWVGDTRQYAVNFTDGNAHLQGIPVHGWSRPAETDVARITALCADFLAGSPRASTDLATTYLSSDGPVDLEAKVYDVTNPAGVVAEIERIAGKLFFVTVDDEVFYDRVDSANYNATLVVTDVSPNLSTEFPPIADGAIGTQDGSELYTGLTLAFGDPPTTVSASDATAESDHDYWREVINSDSSTTAEQATAELASLLEFRKVEEDRFRFAVRLTEAQVGLVKYGQNISFRSAAAGILSPITIRISRLVWEEYAPGIYLAHIENAKLDPRLGRGTRLSDGPSEPGAVVPFVLDSDDSWWQFWGGWDPTAGAYPDFTPDGGADCVGHVYTATMETVSLTSLGAGVFAEPGCVLIGRQVRLGVSRTTDPDDPDIELLTDRLFLSMPAGYTGTLHLVGWKITHTNSPPPAPVLRFRAFGWTGTPAEDLDLGPALDYTMTVGGSATPEGSYYYWPISASLPVVGGGKYALDSLDMAYVDGPFFVGVNISAMDAENADPPAGHATTFISAGPSDGVTTDYTTISPYRPGSLEVYVGGLPWATEGYIETDPATGDWSFVQVPFEGDNPEDNLIEYRYVTA